VVAVTALLVIKLGWWALLVAVWLILYGRRIWTLMTALKRNSLRKP